MCQRRSNCRGLVLVLLVLCPLGNAPAAAGQTAELDKLKQGLQKPLPKDRIAAIQNWKGPEADADKAAQIFVGALSDKIIAVQQAAAAALVKLGDKAVSPIRQTLQNAATPLLRKHCLRVLEELGPRARQAAPTVARLFMDAPDAAKQDAARALNAMGPAGLAAAVDLVRASEKAAVLALRLMGPAASRDAVPMVIDLTKDKDVSTRRGATTLLGNMGAASKTVLPTLAQMFGDPDADVRNRAGTAMLKFGKEANPFLLEQLKVVANQQHWPDLMIFVFRTAPAGLTLPPDLAPIIAKHFEHSDVKVRAAALKALQPFAVRCKELAGSVAPMLADKDAEVRTLATNLLNPLNEGAVPILVKQLKNPSEEVRLATLTHIKSRFAYKAPTMVADLIPLMAEKDSRIRRVTLDLLRETRSTEAIWPLVAALGDDKAEVRERAAQIVRELSYLPLPIAHPWREKGIAGIARGLSDMEPNIRVAANEMLRRAGSDPSVTLIFLKTGDAATKTIAASTIAATGKWAREAVPLLAESLKSDDQAFRTAGLTALTKVGPEAIPVLLDAARAGDMAVIKSFPKMGVPAVTPLMQLTEHKDQTIRLAAVAALGEVRPFSKEVLGHLRKLREGGDEKVRNAVVRVLIPLETPGPENLDFLLLELQEKKSENRRAAGQQLVRIPALAMPRLIELVEKSPDFGVRAEAIFTLGQMGLAAAPAVKPLIDLVRSDKAENQPLKIYALSALDRMHPEANAGLLAILVDAEAPAQVAVLEMLRPEQAKLAKDLVIELLRSKSPEVRTTAARALAKAGPSIAKDLEPLLADKDGEVRAAALLAAENVAAVETLGKYLHDEKLVVRETAERILARKGAAAHGVLREALRSKDYRVQIAAANAIMAVEDRADVLLPGLVEIMLAPGARDLELQAAARAIGRVNPIHGARLMSGKAAVPDLLALLKKQPMEVRELACLALAEKGPAAAEAVPALSDLLKQPKTDVTVLAAAARALNALSPRQKGQDEDAALRLVPDLGARLVKGTHDRSTLLRDEIMTSLQNKFCAHGANAPETILAALHLGQIADDVNFWLAHHADTVKLTEEDGTTYVRILSLYHGGNKNVAAKLSPAAEQALKEQFWRYLVERRGAQILPRPVAKVQVTLPIEQMLGCTTAYLALEVLKDDPLYKDRTLEGRTLQDLHQGWTEWWREWARERAMLGLWSEMGWPPHQVVIWASLFNMHECAGDPVVKQRFKMLLDLSAIEEEQISIQGTRAGRKGRKDAIGCGLDQWKDALQGEQPRRLGEPAFSFSGVVWTSNYQLPPAAILLRKLSRPVPYYAIANRNFFGGCVFGYATPHYVLGCQLAQAEGTVAGTMEAFGSWHRLVFDNMKAIYFPLPSGERRHVQHNNVYITTWDANRVERQSIRFTADLKCVERDGWVFLSNGPAFVGIFVEGGYLLDRAVIDPKALTPPVCDAINLKDARALVLLQAGDVHKFGSFEKFQDAILKAPLVLSKTSLHYTGPQADAIEFFRDRTKPPVIAGPAPANARMMIYDSPYLQCSPGSAQITVRVGSYSAVYDFDGNAIKDAKGK